MSVEPVRVHPDALRGCATGLTGTARRVAAVVPEAPPLVVDAAGWAATGAVVELERAADALFGALGADIELTAGQLRQAAVGYEEADARAVRRFPAGR